MTMVTEYSWENDEFVHHTNGATPGASAGHTPGASDFDSDLDLLYSWIAPPTPPAPPCPEALFSLTLKGKLDGIETLLTVRGMTSAEFRTNLASVRGLLDAVPAKAPAAAAPIPEPGADYCFTHQVAMRWNEGKAGRKGWYSHRTDDGWCKGHVK